MFQLENSGPDKVVKGKEFGGKGEPEAHYRGRLAEVSEAQIRIYGTLPPKKEGPELNLGVLGGAVS